MEKALPDTARNERGCRIINWPRISFAPFFFSSLPSYFLFLLVLIFFELPMAHEELESGALQKTRVRFAEGEREVFRNLNENLEATPFTGLAVSLEV